MQLVFNGIWINIPIPGNVRLECGAPGFKARVCMTERANKITDCLGL